jgi:hypothetical protein
MGTQPETADTDTLKSADRLFLYSAKTQRIRRIIRRGARRPELRVCMRQNFVTKQGSNHLGSVPRAGHAAQ